LVIKILQEWKEQETKPAQDAIGILLVQDIAIVPMFIVLGLLNGHGISSNELMLQLIGGIAAIALVAFLLKKNTPAQMPFRDLFANDTETQVFAALILCFGLSFITALFGLSSALGAFLAGMVVAATRETEWVHTTLEPFRIVFVALFFVSVGMLVDLSFLRDQCWVILSLVIISYAVNSGITACVIKFLGRSWKEALYSALLLSQIGEFSFVLAAAGKEAGLISDYGYDLTLSVIAFNLLLSPAWISIAKKRMAKVQSRSSS
jgi:CPA2 family monovalent cation:H+ antiporter-2